MLDVSSRPSEIFSVTEPPLDDLVALPYTCAPMETLATVFFALAVLTTFAMNRFAHWAHHIRRGR